MTKKNYSLIVVLSIGMVLSIILLTSYALWRMRDGQRGQNDILGACLSIDFNSSSNGMTSPDAWPKTNEEALLDPGYSFTIENGCSEDVNYEIVLDILTPSGNKMPDQYVNIRLDNGGVQKVSSLDPRDPEVEGEYPENLEKIVKVYAGTIPGDGEVSHTIRQWYDESAPSSTIGYKYSTKVEVIAGQKITPDYAITPEECFTFDSSTGTITDYDLDNPICSNKILVLPSTIGGVLVKNIMWSEQAPEDADQFGWGFQATLDAIKGSPAGTINWDYIDLSKAFGLEEIGDVSFESYNGNYELVLPNSLKKIGWGAFYSYSEEELIIPDSVTDISPFAFYWFGGNNLKLGQGLINIGSVAFNAYEGETSELEIPSTVKNIGFGAFTVYSGPRLILHEGLELIQAGAFEYYNGSEFTIPSTIKLLKYNIFNRYGVGGESNNPKVININMSEADFNDSTKVQKDFNWYNHNTTVLNYLVN